MSGRIDVRRVALSIAAPVIAVLFAALVVSSSSQPGSVILNASSSTMTASSWSST